MIPDPRAVVLFASYNIHKCVGTDGRFDPDRTAAVIAELGADVLAVQEADRRFGDRAGLLDLSAIARQTGLEPVDVPRRSAGHGWHGNLLMVRAGLVRAARPITLPGIEPRGAVIADLELPGGPLRVISAHLGLLRHSRLLQIEALLAAAEREAESPTVLLGDFNEWRRAGRSALHGLAPAFGPTGRGVASFPAWFPMLALDRIMARPEAMLGALAAHDTPLARRASDHLPVKARHRMSPLQPSVPQEAAPPEAPKSSRRRSLATFLDRRSGAADETRRK